MKGISYGLVQAHALSIKSGRLRGVRRGRRVEEPTRAPRESALHEPEEQALPDVRESLPDPVGPGGPHGDGARAEQAERHLSRVREGPPAPQAPRSGEFLSG